MTFKIIVISLTTCSTCVSISRTGTRFPTLGGSVRHPCSRSCHSPWSRIVRILSPFHSHGGFGGSGIFSFNRTDLRQVAPVGNRGLDTRAQGFSLKLLDLSLQGNWCIIVGNATGTLQEDSSGIHLGGDQMHCAAGDIVPCRLHPLDGEDVGISIHSTCELG